MSASPALAKRKTKTVKLEDLQVDVFVREKTDPDYVVHLAIMYESGHPIAPIEITKSNRVIDGRHRIAAAQLANLTEIEAYVEDDMPRKEMIARAMSANLGGSRAPTKKDILLTLESMVKAGASDRWIRDHVELPRAVMDTYMGEVRGAIQRQKLAEAKRLLAEGLTVDEAAEKLGITADSIKTRVLGERAAKANNFNIQTAIDRRIAFRNRGIGQKNRYIFDLAVKSFDDGELTKEQVFEVAAAIEHHGQMSVKAADDFRRRFLQRIS